MIYDWDEISIRILKCCNKENSTQIWLVRHGQTDFNVCRVFSGQSEAMLTQRGLTEANKLRKQLPEAIDQIWCSPLQRALDTMTLAFSHVPLEKVATYDDTVNLAFQKMSLETRIGHLGSLAWVNGSSSDRSFEAVLSRVHIDSRFMEISLGDLEGKPFSVVTAGGNHSLDYRPSGGESYREFGRRVMSAFCEVLESADGASSPHIVIFTHAGVIRVLQSLAGLYRTSQDMLYSSPQNAKPVRLSVASLSIPSYWRIA